MPTTPHDTTRKQAASTQCSFATDDTLPSRIDTARHRQALEQAGVIFGDKVEGKPMFTHVTLPSGWRKIQLDQHKWTLVDNEGHTRALMIYRTPFYDCSARLWVPGS